MQSLRQWVLAAPTDDFWQISVTLILVCLAGFFGGFYFLLRKRIIEDIPTSKIRSAAQGYVELSGTGELLDANQPVVAPLTGTICTWYSYSIAERRRTGKRKRWVIVEKGASEQNFLLMDDTGETVVDPDGATVTPAAHDIWYGYSRHPEPKGAPESASSRLFSAGFKRYRYIEKRLHPEEPLYAIGLFKTSGGSHSHFDINADVRDLLSEWKENSDRLLAEFDENSDGRISLGEWDRVRNAALDEVRRRHSELKVLPPLNVIGKTCNKRRPFLLSAVPEQDLVKQFGLYSAAGIGVFFVCGIIAAWMIITRLGG